jgi:hypothetical protein
MNLVISQNISKNYIRIIHKNDCFEISKYILSSHLTKNFKEINMQITTIA